MSEAETPSSLATTEAGEARAARDDSPETARENPGAEGALQAQVRSPDQSPDLVPDLGPEQGEIDKDPGESAAAPAREQAAEDQPEPPAPPKLAAELESLISSSGAAAEASPGAAASGPAAVTVEARVTERPARIWLVVAGLAALALGRLFWLSWDRPRLEDSIREAQRQLEFERAERSSEELRRRAIEDQCATQDARLREQSAAVESLAARLGEREKKLREAAVLASGLASRLDAERGAAAKAVLELALDSPPIQSLPRLAAGLLGMESSRARGELAKRLSSTSRLRWSTPEAITGSRLLRSRDGSLLVALCSDGCVRVLSLPEERLVDRFQSADSSPLVDVALEEGGRYLATLSRLGRVTLWELSEREWRGVAPFKASWSKDLGPVSALCFATSDCLMTAGAEGLLALDVESGGIVGRRALTAGRLTQLRQGWEDGGIIAYGPGAMFFGRVPELNLEPLPLNVEPYDFVAVPSKSGVLLAAGEGCPLIIPNQRYLAPLMSKDEGPQQGAAVALAPDGVGFAVSGPLGIALWKNEQERWKTLSPGKSGVARALAFGAVEDGRCESLYAMSMRQPLRRYDLREGRVAASSEGHSGPIRWLEREPKSRLVAAACGLSVSVWAESDGELVAALPLPSEAACWQGPGRLLTIAATRGEGAPQPKPSLIVWQVQPLKLLARIEGRPARGEFVGAGALISQGDGRHYFSAHEDGSYRVWDLELGVEVSSQWIHESSIRALSYEASKRLLFSATAKGELRAHQAELGTELGRLELGEDLSRLCAIDGRSEVALLCASGRALIWSPESGLKLIPGVSEPCQWMGQDRGDLLLARGESLLRLRWRDGAMRLSRLEDLPPNVGELALGEAGELLLGLKSGSIQCWQPETALPQRRFADFDKTRAIWDLARTPSGANRALREDGLVFQSRSEVEVESGRAAKNQWNLGRADLAAGALSADGQRCILGGMNGWALVELKDNFETSILIEGLEPSNAVALAGECWAALSQPQGPLLVDIKSGARRSLALGAEPLRMIEVLEQGEEDVQVFGASGPGLWFWKGAAEARSLLLDQPVQDIAACERGLDWCLAALDESYGVSLIDSSLAVLVRIESTKPVKKIALSDNGRILFRLGPGGRVELAMLEWLDAARGVEVGPWIELETEGSEGPRAICLGDGLLWSSRGDSLTVCPLSVLRTASSSPRELVIQVEERTGMRVISSELALTIGARLLPCRD